MILTRIQETINTGEDIQVQFMAYRSNKWETETEIEVDGVTINSEVTNIISGQGTIKFIASGIDIRSINNITSHRVKITIDGKENLYNVQLYVAANGDFHLDIYNYPEFFLV